MRKRTLLLIVTVLLAVLLAPTIASAHYTRAKTRKTIAEAGRYYHLKHRQIVWLQTSGIDIIYGPGAHESNGSERAGAGRACVGILQFNRSWGIGRYIPRHLHHRHADWRKCGKCSLYRFVLVYKQGGKPAIRRHWAATLGR